KMPLLTELPTFYHPRGYRDSAPGGAPDWRRWFGRHEAKVKAALHAAVQDLADGRWPSHLAKLLECGAKRRFGFHYSFQVYSGCPVPRSPISHCPIAPTSGTPAEFPGLCVVGLWDMG